MELDSIPHCGRSAWLRSGGRAGVGGVPAAIDFLRSASTASQSTEGFRRPGPSRPSARGQHERVHVHLALFAMHLQLEAVGQEPFEHVVITSRGGSPAALALMSKRTVCTHSGPPAIWPGSEKAG